MKDLGKYEILDRTSLILSHINDDLLLHPRLKKNKKIRKRIEKAISELANVYQWAGDCLK